MSKLIKEVVRIAKEIQALELEILSPEVCDICGQSVDYIPDDLVIEDEENVTADGPVYKSRAPICKGDRHKYNHEYYVKNRSKEKARALNYVRSPEGQKYQEMWRGAPGPTNPGEHQK